MIHKVSLFNHLGKWDAWVDYMATACLFCSPRFRNTTLQIVISDLQSVDNCLGNSDNNFSSVFVEREYFNWQSEMFRQESS